MHTQPRGGTIEKLVLHDNEGPPGPNAAAALAGYLQHIDGGYHAIFDDQHTVVVVSDQTEVWGNGGINSTSLDGCLIGYASSHWNDPYSQAEIRQAAVWFASKCKQYGIPARRLSPQEVATPGTRGICRHWDVTLAGFPGSAGHSDPGPNFDFDGFVAQVAALVNPAPTAPTWRLPLIWLSHPDGGTWIVMDGPGGQVNFLSPTGAVVPSGMDQDPKDRNAFGPRIIGSLVARTRNDGKHGFSIVATDHAKYVPKKQR